MSLASTEPSITNEQAITAAWGDKPDRLVELAFDLAEHHNQWHAQSLNLSGGENYVSPKAKALLSSKLIDSMTSKGLGARIHTGGAVLDRLETLHIELAKKLFRVPYVEYRALSGATANGLFLFGATEPGDRVMALPAQYGGHYSYREGSYGGQKGLQFSDIPCYGDDYPIINLELLADEVEMVRPHWITVGSATSLFPYPVKEMSEIAGTVGARIWFDGAHTLGLTVGDQFQDPLHEGASAMTGSTQKTLAGPLGGLILMHDGETAERVSRMTPSFIASYNNSRTAAMVVTLAEMMAFGREYAAAVVANAQALASALDAEGFTVAGKDRGYTQSHIVLVDLTDTPGKEEAFHRLDAAHVVYYQVPIPRTFPRREAMCLATQACTRLGMGVGEMREAARLLRRMVLDREDPVLVGRDVAELASGFAEVRYCF